MKPAHLHLTLAMLKLYSEERRALARQVGWGVARALGGGGSFAGEALARHAPQ